MDSNLVVVVVEDSSLKSQQQNQKMITTMLWGSKEMQMKIKSRRHLRSKRLSTTRTKTGMTQRKLKKSSKKSLMLTKSCQIQINEEFMTNKERRECSNKLNGKARKEADNKATSTLTLMTSLGVVVVAEVNTFINNSSKK